MIDSKTVCNCHKERKGYPPLGTTPCNTFFFFHRRNDNVTRGLDLQSRSRGRERERDKERKREREKEKRGKIEREKEKREREREREGEREKRKKLGPSDEIGRASSRERV